MRRLIRIVLAALLVLAGCAAPPPPDETAARHAIDSLHTRIERWYRAGRSDSIASLYLPDALIFLPNAPPVAGRDSIEAHWERMFDGIDWDVELETESLVAQGPLAVEHGRYLIVLNREGFPTPLATDRGHYLVTWQHTPGGWRIRFDIALSEVPRHAE